MDPHKTGPSSWRSWDLKKFASNLVALRAFLSFAVPRFVWKKQLPGNNGNPGFVNPWLLNRGCPPFAGVHSSFVAEI